MVLAMPPSAAVTAQNLPNLPSGREYASTTRAPDPEPPYWLFHAFESYPFVCIPDATPMPRVKVKVQEPTSPSKVMVKISLFEEFVGQ